MKPPPYARLILSASVEARLTKFRPGGPHERCGKKLKPGAASAKVTPRMFDEVLLRVSPGSSSTAVASSP